MSAELAAAHVSLFAETSHLARGAAQAIDRIGADAERSLTRAFSAAGGSITRGGLGSGLTQSMQTAGQAAGQAGGRAAAQGFSAQLNRIDATAFNRIARGAEGASEEIQRLNRWQLNDLIREANRAGQQLGQPLEAGASAAQRALRRLDAEGLENLIRSATQARSAIGRVGDEAAQATRSSAGAARAAGEESGQQAAQGMGDKLAGLLGGKAGIVGSTVAAAFSLAGFSAGGLFIKALQNGMEQERVLDLNQARLGVDDQTMQKIGFAAGRAFAGNFGESVESNIDTARRAINSGLLDRSGTAQETQQIIQQLTSVSDLMGEEIPAVARAAGQAVKTGIAGSATDAFDLFVAAEQNGLNVSEDFLDTITEYGTQFRKLGLSGPEAVGLINQAVQAGARDTDVAADAIKEFSIRVVDGSDSTKEAFETLGFGADDLAKKFAQGGSVARTAVGDLLGKIREIEDPVEKNKIALALFGTQFEDLGDALNQFNLDDAAASLGKVAGAADEAISTMGENSAGSIESAKRSIQISTDEISKALADAFGPELAKLADWVTQHQPEILGFLGKVADFAFKAADGFLAFASGSLRALASFAEGAGPLLATILDPIGAITEVFGKLTHNSDLENFGRSVRNLDVTFQGAADAARSLADGIDNTLRPGLDGLREGVAQTIEESRLAQEVFRALGQTVTAIPTEHDIILKDNTPEATARLEAMGLKVTTLPNGEVHVTADTADGQAKLDAFIVANTGRVLPLKGYVSFNQSIPVDTLAKTHDIPPGLASGGVFQGQGGPTADGNLIRISNREHLAYITRAQATNPATIPFLDAINAGWVPPAELLHGMIPGFADGGLVPGKKFAQSMDPAPYVYGGFSASGIDCSGMVSATINDALGLPPFSSRMATASEGGWLAVKGAQAGLGGPGDLSVGWYNGGAGGGHTAMTLSDGTNVESNGTEGVVIGGPVGANDPMFTNKMHIPAALLRGGDLGGGASGGVGGSGLGGSGDAGGGVGGAGGAGGAGGTFGGAAVPAGVTPVWIVGGALTGNAAASNAATSSDSAAAPSESFAPQASTQPAQMPDIGSRALQAGQNFLSANVDQFLGDIGIRKSGGAIQALVGQIFDAMARATAEAVAQAQRSQQGSMIRHSGGGLF